MTKKTRDCPFSIKSLNEETGEFEGYLSVFDVVDLGGDLVRPGAFKKTLSEKKRFLLRYEHKYNIGYFEGNEDLVGLYVKGRLLLEIEKAREAYALMKADPSLLAMSIGYNVLQEEWDKSSGENVRLLKELRLLEGSVVSFPMNPAAKITEVKSLTAEDILSSLNANPDLRAQVADALKTTDPITTPARIEDQPEPEPKPSAVEQLTEAFIASLRKLNQENCNG